MTATTASFAVVMLGKENSGTTLRAELGLTNQLPIRDGIL